MEINFNVNKNFICYLNEAMHSIELALENKDEKYYKYACIFTAFTIEIGLAVIAKDALNQNIYRDATKSKTVGFDQIKNSIKSYSSPYLEKLFPDFNHFDSITPLPMKSIQINLSILKNEIDRIIEMRDRLVHFEGIIETEKLMTDIFSTLLFLNMLLPKYGKFDDILSLELKQLYLDNSLSQSVILKLSKDFSLFEEDEQYYTFSGHRDIGDCEECGYSGICKIGVKENMLGYLCLLCMSHGYLIDCIKCGDFVFPWDAHKWDDNGIEHICNNCL